MRVHVVFLALTVIVSACNSDVEDAEIEGKVIDARTEAPIEGVRLVVENAYYEGGDYDSYSKYDTINAVTDDSGVFQLRFRKSAFVVIYAIKAGYQKEVAAKDIYSSRTRFFIKLKKQ